MHRYNLDDFLDLLFGLFEDTEGDIIFLIDDGDEDVEVVTRDMEKIEEIFPQVLAVNIKTNKDELADLIMLDEGDSDEDGWVDIEPVVAKESSSEVTKIQDAEIVGDIEHPVLQREMTVLYGKSGVKTYRDAYTPQTGPFIDLLKAHFLKHRQGKKDGPCIVLGSGKARAKASMHAANLVGIDVDSGTTLEEIDVILEDLGLFAIRYTTHSHLVRYTDINQDRLLKELDLEDGEKPTREHAVAYLTMKKGMNPTVFTGVDAEPEFIHEERPIYRIYHNPIHKFRIIFPLVEEWPFSLETESHANRLNKFAAKLYGLERMLGVRMDRSCTDPSRLFFLPSHAKGGDFSIKIFGGEPLDFDSLSEVEPSKDFSNPFLEAGASMSGKKLVTPGGKSLTRWAATNADGFEIRDVIERFAPEKMRGETTGVHNGLVVECPFDELHSNAGDPDDSATFVVNGSDSESGGFIIACHHDSCKQTDRLEFLLKMLEDWNIPEEVLFDEQYNAIIAETDEEYEEKATVKRELREWSQIEDAIEDLTPEDDDLQELILKAMAWMEPTSSRLSKHLKRISTKVKVKMTALETDYKRALKKIAGEKIDNDEREGRTNKPMIYTDRIQYEDQVKKAWRLISIKQKDDPEYFWSDRGLPVMLHEEVGEIGLRDMNTDDIRWAAGKACMWRTMGMEDEQTTPPPPQVIQAMQRCSRSETKLPFLKSIVSNPFFDEDGNLISDPGYHDAGYYLTKHGDLAMDPVPEMPTDEEVKTALDLLMDNIFVDFPFEGDDEGTASRCHALAMLLQPFMRFMIDGPTPIFFIDKPLPGTGATLLINAVLMLATGRDGIAMTMPTTEDEVKKMVISKLLDGSSYMWFDNIDKPIDSQTLASATTARIYEGRGLGGNNMIRIPVRAQWIFCGNNPHARSEMVRRLVRIHLDAKQVDPTTRGGFKHKNLPRWVLENRSDLVHACLTLIQKWISDGMPRSDHEMASYEEWSSMMGGVMESIGVEGFLGNAHELKNTADNETAVINEFCQIWYEFYDTDIVPLTEGGDMEDPGGLQAVLREQQVPMVNARDEGQLRNFLARKLRYLRGRHVFVYTETEKVEVCVDVCPQASGMDMYKLRRVKSEPLEIDEAA